MKQGVFAALLFFVCAGAFSIGVDENELKVRGSDSVQFENYGGPHSVIETAQQITDIGRGLGSQIAGRLETQANIEPYSKYSLVHVVSPERTEKLDADILFINENAMVDHIRNLRRIVSGFLQAAYGYTPEDADTLSVFVTVYNAVYRGDIQNFSSKYSSSVMQYLTENSVGLSTNWEDWAGKTQIVIPLNEPTEEGLSAVDTTVISDEQVIEALKQDEDKGVEVREQLTDIKEREAEQASQKAQEAQKTAVQERKEGNTAKAEQASQKAATQQQTADRKTSEVRAEKKELAADKKEVQEKVAEPKKYVSGLFGAQDKTGLFTIMTVDAESGAVVKTSPVKQIRTKELYKVSSVTVQNDEGKLVSFAELYIAVCGVNDKRSAVRLCLIDPDSLEIQKQSTEKVSDGAQLVPYQDSFFTVIQDGKNYYVAQYDKNVNLIRKSSQSVKYTTPLNLTPYGILVTDTKDVPRLLSYSDLSLVWTTTSSTADAK